MKMFNSDNKLCQFFIDNFSVYCPKCPQVDIMDCTVIAHDNTTTIPTMITINNSMFLKMRNKDIFSNPITKIKRKADTARFNA
jgi:hypothetical protein